MTKYFLLFILLALHPVFGQVQDTIKYLQDYSVVVDSIKLVGNETTEDFIIMRELNFSPGDTLTPELAKYNRDRIYSLGIFNIVEVYPETVGGKNYAVIDVEEGWYIYPVPFLEMRENDWKKISYGAILVVKNFRGRNETVSFSGAFGYNPFLRLMYYNPYLSREDDIFFNISASYGTVSNKSSKAEALHGSDFDQKNITGSVEVGKRFGLFHRLSLTAGFSYVETPFFIKGVSASDSRIDHTPFISIGYSYDTRDLIQFPLNGLLGAAAWEFKGLGSDGIDYNIFKLDFREYRPIIGDLHAKWRFTSRITGGKLVPFYDLSYIGFDERIRGHYTEQLEGNNYYLGSIELFYPILKDIHINLDFVPLLPKSLLSYRVAMYTELFGDAGTTKFKREKLSMSDIRSGYGAGIILLILPYNVVRFEVGLDEYHNAEFIFNVAVSF